MARSAQLNMTKRPIRQRFLSKVNETKSEIFWGGERCHEWTGCIMKNGYGQFNIDRRAQYAHRVSWEIHRGQIPDGLFILHRCDNRKCVNPEHLFLGTFRENMDDMLAKKRQTTGTKHWRHKLTEDDVREIRASSLKQQELAEIYGIQQPTISMIRSGKIWRLVEKI